MDHYGEVNKPRETKSMEHRKPYIAMNQNFKKLRIHYHQLLDSKVDSIERLRENNILDELKEEFNTSNERRISHRHVKEKPIDLSNFYSNNSPKKISN